MKFKSLVLLFAVYLLGSFATLSATKLSPKSGASWITYIPIVQANPVLWRHFEDLNLRLDTPERLVAFDRLMENHPANLKTVENLRFVVGNEIEELVGKMGSEKKKFSTAVKLDAALEILPMKGKVERKIRKKLEKYKKNVIETYKRRIQDTADDFDGSGETADDLQFALNQGGVKHPDTSNSFTKPDTKDVALVFDYFKKGKMGEKIEDDKGKYSGRRLDFPRPKAIISLRVLFPKTEDPSLQKYMELKIREEVKEGIKTLIYRFSADGTFIMVKVIRPDQSVGTASSEDAGKSVIDFAYENLGKWIAALRVKMALDEST